MAAAEGPHQTGQAVLVAVLQELAAVVGLPLDAAQVHTVPGQVGADAFGQEGHVALGEFVAAADEAEAADDLADAVLEAGQAQVLHLGPVAGDVAEVFGLGHQLAEEWPLGSDGAQAAFGEVFLFAGAHELVAAQDALDSADAGGQGELDFEPLGTEAGAAAQAHDLALQGGAGLVGAAMGPLGDFGQRGRFARPVATQPFADGVAGAAEAAGGGLDAMNSGVGHDAFTSPALVNTIYGRWWHPLDEKPGPNPVPGGPLPWTGDFTDGLRNKISMLAYANPPAIADEKQRAGGYGVARFNKKKRTITFECWPRFADVKHGDKVQFPGWPITVATDANDGRKVHAHLPAVRLDGVGN